MKGCYCEHLALPTLCGAACKPWPLVVGGDIIVPMSSTPTPEPGEATLDPATWPPTIVYAVGLCNASMCTAEEDVAVAMRHLNMEHPTGIGRWTLSDQPFVDEDRVPQWCALQCPDAPNRRHVLASC